MLSIPVLALLYILPGQKFAVQAVLFVTDSILATGNYNGALCVWKDDARVTEVRSSSTIRALAISSDHMHLAAANYSDKNVKVFETSKYECVSTIKCPDKVHCTLFAIT